VAAAITQATEIDVTLEPGDRGEFTVWVGDDVVARKTLDGFPEPDQVVTAIRAAIPVALR